MAGWNAQRVKIFKEGFADFLKHVMIASKEREGYHPLKLYNAQKRFLSEVFASLAKDIHWFVVLKARQLGMSTIVRCLIVYWAFMHPGLRVGLIFDTDQNKESAREEIKQFLERLPPSHSIQITTHSKTQLVFGNGSIVTYRVAGIKKTASSGGLGRSIGLNCLGGTEVSSWADIEGVRALERSLAQNAENRLYVWESTARGFNIFYDLCEEAKADDLTKKFIFIGWWGKEDYSLQQGSPLYARYSFPPTDEELKKIQAVKLLYDHDVTMEQLAWYRHEYDPTRLTEDEERAGQDVIQQELPWCVVAGTRVGTDSGIIKIEFANPGMSGTFGEVTHAGPTGVSQTYELTTELGYSVVGTGNHPIALRNGGFVDLAKALGKTIRLAPPRFAKEEFLFSWREGPVESTVRITPDFARLVGLYMGDGSMQGGSKNGGAGYFSIACDRKDQDVVAECKRLIKQIFGIDSHSHFVGAGCEDVRVGSRLIVETFRRMGLARNDTGKTMRRVHVPEFIWQSPQGVVREFLRGLFEADGFNGYNTNRVVLFSKWPAFLADVQILLLGFGITCKRRSRLARTTYTRNGAKRSHEYTANELTLRSEEAIAFNEKIGFLGRRKIARFDPDRVAPPKVGGANRIRMVLEDLVSSVNMRDVETVYNLTVRGTPEDHIFDANGILTHNTEEDAFLQSGVTFFPGEKLTTMTALARAIKPQYYRYYMDDEFTNTIVERVGHARLAQVKVWEEPDPGATYTIGADPAYGSDDDADRYAASVLRCYADGVDQVAEFCERDMTCEQFAWVLLHLCGFYGKAKLLLELNGPGHEVWSCFRRMRNRVVSGDLRLAAAERGMTNVFDNVKEYIWAKEDSISRTPSAFHWETSGKRKVAIMESMRSMVGLGQLNVRSVECLEEMKKIIREGDKIHGEGVAKDDRVIALALALRAWNDPVTGERRKLLAQGLTREAEAKRQNMTPADLYQMFNKGVFENFFSQKRTERIMNQRRARRGSRWSW